MVHKYGYKSWNRLLQRNFWHKRVIWSYLKDSYKNEGFPPRDMFWRQYQWSWVLFSALNRLINIFFELANEQNSVKIIVNCVKEIEGSLGPCVKCLCEKSQRGLLYVCEREREREKEIDYFYDTYVHIHHVV